MGRGFAVFKLRNKNFGPDGSAPNRTGNSALMPCKNWWYTDALQRYQAFPEWLVCYLYPSLFSDPYRRQFNLFCSNFFDISG
jgi:hypothetical protein